MRRRIAGTYALFPTIRLRPSSRRKPQNRTLLRAGNEKRRRLGGGVAPPFISTPRQGRRNAPVHPNPTREGRYGKRRHLGGGVAPTAAHPGRGRRKPLVHHVPAFKAGIKVRRHLGGGVAPTARTPGTREEVCPRCITFRHSGPVWEAVAPGRRSGTNRCTPGAREEEAPGASRSGIQGRYGKRRHLGGGVVPTAAHRRRGRRKVPGASMSGHRDRCVRGGDIREEEDAAAKYRFPREEEEET